MKSIGERLYFRLESDELMREGVISLYVYVKWKLKEMCKRKLNAYPRLIELYRAVCA